VRRVARSEAARHFCFGERKKFSTSLHESFIKRHPRNIRLESALEPVERLADCHLQTAGSRVEQGQLAVFNPRAFECVAGTA
jgi:hypothetical protein